MWSPGPGSAGPPASRATRGERPRRTGSWSATSTPNASAPTRTSSGSGRSSPGGWRTWRTSSPRSGSTAGSSAHAAGGTLPDLHKEFQLLLDADLVRRELMAIHGGALGGPDFQMMATGDATLVWSPFSNLWLYGATADIAAAKAAGVRLCLGSDWAPSGTRNVLWELKVADLWNQAQAAPVFTDEELVGLVTANPGEALSGVWPRPVGRLQAGALAALLVVPRRHPDPYRNLIRATEADVRLVVVGGKARSGTRALLAGARAGPATA